MILIFSITLQLIILAVAINGVIIVSSTIHENSLVFSNKNRPRHSAIATQGYTLNMQSENSSTPNNTYVNPIELLIDEESTKNRILSQNLLSMIIRHEKYIELMNKDIEVQKRKLQRLEEEKLSSPYSETQGLQQRIDNIQKQVSTLTQFKETSIMAVTMILQKDGTDLLNQQKKDVEEMKRLGLV
jgi:hypothetical protein